MQNTAVIFGLALVLTLACSLLAGYALGRFELPGNRWIARVLFALRQGRILALHGFIKKTQKTPPAKIKLVRNDGAWSSGDLFQDHRTPPPVRACD